MGWLEERRERAFDRHHESMLQKIGAHHAKVLHLLASNPNVSSSDYATITSKYDRSEAEHDMTVFGMSPRQSAKSLLGYHRNPPPPVQWS